MKYEQVKNKNKLTDLQRDRLNKIYLKDAKHMIASETGRANEIIDGLEELKKFVKQMEEANGLS